MAAAEGRDNRRGKTRRRRKVEVNEFEQAELDDTGNDGRRKLLGNIRGGGRERDERERKRVTEGGMGGEVGEDHPS